MKECVQKEKWKYAQNEFRKSSLSSPTETSQEYNGDDPRRNTSMKNCNESVCYPHLKLLIHQKMSMTFQELRKMICIPHSKSLRCQKGYL